MIRRRISVALLAAGLAVLAASGPVGSAGAVPTVGPRSTAVTDQGRQQAGGNELSGRHSLRAPVTDETFYFVMADRFENGDTDNDRGGISGDRLQHGFDPTNKGFYQGGDLKGLLDRIDYIQGLGTTSIWLTPSFKNKAVQLEDGPSAGYHGYWVTDFTQIDPHLGTKSVTVAGSLQSEIGCPGDWDPACAASHLTFNTNNGLWEGTFQIDPGNYEYKVAIDNSWDVNYGAGGAAGGSNIAISIPSETRSVTFVSDQVTHVVTHTLNN